MARSRQARVIRAGHRQDDSSQGDACRTVIARNVGTRVGSLRQRRWRLEQVEFAYPQGRKNAEGISLTPDYAWAKLRLGASRREIERLVGKPLSIKPLWVDHGAFAGKESIARLAWNDRTLMMRFEASTLDAIYVDLPELRALNDAQFDRAEARLEAVVPFNESPLCQSVSLERKAGRFELTTDDCD